jgi:hypothetical protein
LQNNAFVYDFEKAADPDTKAVRKAVEQKEFFSGKATEDVGSLL